MGEGVRKRPLLVKRETYLAIRMTFACERRDDLAPRHVGSKDLPLVLGKKKTPNHFSFHGDTHLITAVCLTAVCLIVKIPTPLVIVTCPVRLKRPTSA